MVISFFKKYNIPVTVLIFTGLESLIYIIYLSLDVLSLHTLKVSDLFKYGGIFICFLYTLLQNAAQKFQQQRQRYLLLCALLVLFSDYCLLFTTHYLPGILIFTLVQCFYFAAMTQISRLPVFFTLSAILAFPTTLFLAVYANLKDRSSMRPPFICPCL